ncbi:serine/threonine protein kinase, putative [Entamoeba dispar SAW760]|uniref:non-specific serine/threonine protein kinase n=1 Tax=Entamoeba dispar (strain ATCC PRA-260 / SAW760) TaxID=370354 RepID=B0EAZ2_ENTDS|nr:serine/threonine protein kinase, putative [Entamoeba dispar SAW760]EDR28299.1 serine/threonine protein kinase, putative [Entamoeba dispar SAW760]|eukprot:EDR28299.1 serine/threonine protein kinase, putative [Entamoeba dispar SAW760]
MNETHVPVLTIHTNFRKNRQSCFSPSSITQPIDYNTEDVIVNTLTKEREINYTNILISSVKSEIMIDTINTIPIIVHIISFTCNSRIHTIEKTANDLYELDAFFKSSYPVNGFPLFPKRSISYPMRDTALCEYLQAIINISGVCDSEYFKQWISTSLSNSIISIRRPIISGDLKKEGYILKRWVTRYVLVKRNYLIYFVSDKEFSKLTLPTILDLKGANVKVSDMKEKTFHIKLSSGAVYHFKTKSRELLGEWIVALQSSTVIIQRRRDRRQSVYSEETSHKPVTPIISLQELLTIQSTNNEIVTECMKIVQTHKEDTSLIHLCKRLESIDLLDAIELNQIISQIKEISLNHPEDVQLLKLLRLLSSNEIKRIETRSKSHSHQSSRSQSRKQSVSSLDISSISSNESSTTVTPRSGVICRICEAKVLAEHLARHTYYCKTLNEICMKSTTDAERLKGIVEEAKRISELKKTDYFKRLIEVSEAAIRIMGESLQKQYDNLKVYNEVSVDLVGSYQHDVCGYVFAFYVQKLIHHKTDILGKYIENPNNPRQLLNALGAGVRLDETWNNIGLKDFEIIKRINGGAYSSVYLVRKKVTNDIYAMKIMKKADMIRKNVVDGVLAEKTILQRAQTSSVVKMYYAFQDTHNLFLVMEYCPGGDLRCLLSNVGYLDETTAKIYSAEIVLALEYIHSLGCIHRDLKPDNVLIDKNGHLLLTDFGLSTVGSKIEQTIEDSRLVCTPDYVAPESIVSFQYSRCSDYFSLGSMIFEFICGVPPFHEETPDAIFQNIRTGKYSWPSSINPSNELKSIVSGLLTIEVKKRLGYKSIQEIKSHPWFEGINWNTLLSESREDIFVPELDNETDTGYFEVDSQMNNSTLSNDFTETKGSNILSRTKGDHCEKFNKFNGISFHHLVEENMSIANEVTTSEDDRESNNNTNSDSQISVESFEEETNETRDSTDSKQDAKSDNC